MGIYTTFQKGGKDVAGMMNSTGPIGKSRWGAYIAVDNINECVSKAEDLGAKVLMRPYDIADTGHVCMISDPVGAVFCLMQPISNK